MTLKNVIKLCNKHGARKAYSGICRECGIIFYTLLKTKRDIGNFCKNGCSKKHGKGRYDSCKNCKKKVYRKNWHWKTMKNCFCSNKCRFKYLVGENNPFFKGFRKNKRGYVGCRKNGIHILEHREIMEKHIGRKLFPFESIHHKNGIKSDNKISNLELFTTRGHKSGQRISDLLKFCVKNYHKELTILMK